MVDPYGVVYPDAAPLPPCAPRFATARRVGPIPKDPSMIHRDHRQLQYSSIKAAWTWPANGSRSTGSWHTGANDKRWHDRQLHGVTRCLSVATSEAVTAAEILADSPALHSLLLRSNQRRAVKLRRYNTSGPTQGSATRKAPWGRLSSRMFRGRCTVHERGIRACCAGRAWGVARPPEATSTRCTCAPR
jgi:hypothetical protein